MAKKIKMVHGFTGSRVHGFTGSRSLIVFYFYYQNQLINLINLLNFSRPAVQANLLHDLRDVFIC